jgi:hypothetical protein
MVYCAKCGTKNEAGARYCVKCGAALGVTREERFERRAQEWGEEFGRRAEEWGEQFGRRMEEEGCFGLPHGGAIVGLIIGAIIVLVGLSLLAGMNWMKYVGPLAVVVFGILIVAGALYGLRRRY